MHFAQPDCEMRYLLLQVSVPARVQPLTCGAGRQNCDAACEEVSLGHDVQAAEHIPLAKGLCRDPGQLCASSFLQLFWRLPYLLMTCQCIRVSTPSRAFAQCPHIGFYHCPCWWQRASSPHYLTHAYHTD